MHVGDGDTADDGADDANKPWSVPHKNRFFRCVVPSQFLVGRHINGTVVVRRKPSDGFGCEHIGIDDVLSEIGNEPYG